MKLRWVVAAMAAVTVVAAASASLALALTRGARADRPLVPVASKAEHITVEGQWRLEVRNPDGSVVSVTQFHNAPTLAAQAIATILTRTFSPGYWFISLSSSTSDGPCLDSASGAATGCELTDPNDTGGYSSASFTFKTLTTSHSSTQSSITLNGSLTAQRNGSIDVVATNIWLCSASTAPSAPCASNSFWPFTSRTLASAVSLVTGQQLLVTVTLSFS